MVNETFSRAVGSLKNVLRAIRSFGGRSFDSAGVDGVSFIGVEGNDGRGESAGSLSRLIYGIDDSNGALRSRHSVNRKRVNKHKWSTHNVQGVSEYRS